MTVKIYGYGWVGKAVQEVFPDAIIHDPAQGFWDESHCDVGFVCVPTPNTKNGLLDMSIVEDVVKNSNEGLLIVRSAVNPGTCDRLAKLYKKKICYQPEYLGETVAHPLLDETKAKFLIIGGQPQWRRRAIELFQTVYNATITIRQLSNLEAEIVKLSENRAIAYKVLQCQELYDACEAAGVDYNNIREAVYGDDPRFNLYWTFVYPNARGAKSKCIPKDVLAWAAWAETVGIEPKLTNALLEYNQELIDE